MSVTQVKRSSGNKRAYKVMYRDHNDKQRAETYAAKTDAEKRDVEIRQAKQRREPIPRRGRGDQRETLGAFAQGVWWPQRAAQLQKKTQEGYAAFLDKHLIPRVGDEPLTYIDVERCIELRAELAKDGVPGYTSARVLKLLRQILAHAVLIQRLPYNPADVFGQRGQLPSQKRKSPMRPLWPADTEAIRRAILARKTPYSLRDATLVSVLAYAGLRPEEALALAWEHIGKNTIKVVRANTNGSFNQTKTGHHRTVPHLIQPLMDDLTAWREACPDSSPAALVFPAENGDLWTEAAYKSWTKRVFRPITDHRVYDLRDGYACLLAREGVSTTEAAMRCGHSEAVHLDSYRTVFIEYRDEPTISMQALVDHARQNKSTKSQHSMGDERKRSGRPKLAAVA
jgi:integrase